MPCHEGFSDLPDPESRPEHQFLNSSPLAQIAKSGLPDLAGKGTDLEGV